MRSPLDKPVSQVMIIICLSQATDTKPPTNTVHARTEINQNKKEKGMSHSRGCLTHFRRRGFVSVSSPWQRRVSSVDGQLDVGLLVVLQQRRHPHGVVAAAQHAFFDAGGLDLTDEALQRLQAAAERCGVAQAGTGQATTDVLVRAEGLGVRRGGRVERLSLWVVVVVVVMVEVWVEVVMGKPQVSGPGCARTRCQHLRRVTVAVGGGHGAVPERSEVLSDGELPLVTQGGSAQLLLPTAGSMRPVRQLRGAPQREAGFRGRAGLFGSIALSAVTHAVHPQRPLLVQRLDLMLVRPRSEVSLLQVPGFGHVRTLRGYHRPR